MRQNNSHMVTYTIAHPPQSSQHTEHQPSHADITQQHSCRRPTTCPTHSVLHSAYDHNHHCLLSAARKRGTVYRNSSPNMYLIVLAIDRAGCCFQYGAVPWLSTAAAPSLTTHDPSLLASKPTATQTYSRKPSPVPSICVGWWLCSVGRAKA